MQASDTAEGRLAEIIRRDVAKAVRGAALLYAVNAIIFVAFDLAIFLFGSPFLFFFIVSGFTWIADIIALGFSLYAITAFLFPRHRQSSRLGLHFYILGILGLSVGAILFSWGAVQFLSAGYWLRQYNKKGVARSAKDEGEIAVYGNDSSVNVKSSKLVRIGFDLPRSWINAGLVALVVGVVLYYSSILVRASIGPISATSIGSILFIDGIAFFSTILVRRMGFESGVRLPPSSG